MTERPLSAPERETTVTASDGDDLTRVWTAQGKFIRRLRAHPGFTEVAAGWHGSTEWAEFTIDAADWNPASGGRRPRNLTDEQRAAAAQRLAAARERRHLDEDIL